MRNFIFEFEQKHALKFKLSVNDLLLFSYFIKFFQVSRAKYKELGNQKYYLIRYSKLISDLPILGSIKTIRRMMDKLEKKELINRWLINKRDLYVYVNWFYLNGFQTEEDRETELMAYLKKQEIPQTKAEEDELRNRMLKIGYYR